MPFVASSDQQVVATTETKMGMGKSNIKNKRQKIPSPNAWTHAAIASRTGFYTIVNAI